MECWAERAVGIFATFFGLDRDRVLYPTSLIIIASYYALFAVIGNSAHALMVESIVIVGFLFASVAGFRTSLWLVVPALAAAYLAWLLSRSRVRTAAI